MFRTDCLASVPLSRFMDWIIRAGPKFQRQAKRSFYFAATFYYDTNYRLFIQHCRLGPVRCSALLTSSTSSALKREQVGVYGAYKGTETSSICTCTLGGSITNSSIQGTRVCFRVCFDRTLGDVGVWPICRPTEPHCPTLNVLVRVHDAILCDLLLVTEILLDVMPRLDRKARGAETRFKAPLKQGIIDGASMD
jgi:hypothetical protein